MVIIKLFFYQHHSHNPHHQLQKPKREIELGTDLNVEQKKKHNVEQKRPETEKKHSQNRNQNTQKMETETHKNGNQNPGKNGNQNAHDSELTWMSNLVVVEVEAAVLAHHREHVRDERLGRHSVHGQLISREVHLFGSTARTSLVSTLYMEAQERHTSMLRPNWELSSLY